MKGPLISWRDGAAKQAVCDFVSRTCGETEDSVPVEERVAVFDNDGTLWCEKPLPIQADFILRRLAAMAEDEQDYGWLSQVLAEHYSGDDSNVRVLLGGVLAAHSGISVETFEAEADS